jgi:pantoate kinase
VGGGGRFEAVDDTVAERAEALVAQLDGDLAADDDDNNAGTWRALGPDAATAHASTLGPVGCALGLSEAQALCLAKAAGAAPALLTDEPEPNAEEWFDL